VALELRIPESQFDHVGVLPGGVRAEVHFGNVPFWQDRTGRVPRVIHHPGLGHVWMVFGVLDSWARNLRARTEPGVTAWWICRVHGPLPGTPSQVGKFVLSVSSYEGVDGWWIEPLTID
jgi:hypothetical protein